MGTFNMGSSPIQSQIVFPNPAQIISKEPVRAFDRQRNISAISSNMLSVGWSPVRRRFENRFFVTSSRRSKA